VQQVVFAKQGARIRSPAVCTRLPVFLAE
jgi:hypothetical protein